MQHRSGWAERAAGGMGRGRRRRLGRGRRRPVGDDGQGAHGQDNGRGESGDGGEPAGARLAQKDGPADRSEGQQAGLGRSIGTVGGDRLGQTR